MITQQRVYAERKRQDPEWRAKQSLQRKARRAKLNAERLAQGILCSVQDCPKPVKSYGMCNAHACKARRNNALPPMEKIDNNDFWEFVKKELGL